VEEKSPLVEEGVEEVAGAEEGAVALHRKKKKLTWGLVNSWLLREETTFYSFQPMGRRRIVSRDSTSQ